MLKKEFDLPKTGIPLINVSPKLMPTPGISASSVLSKNQAAEDIITETNLGRVHSVLCVMSKPGIRELPDRFYSVGVVCVHTLIRKEDGERIAFTGISRARIKSLGKNNHDPESFWIADIEILDSDKEKEEFEGAVFKKIMSKLLKIKHLFLETIEISHGLWRIPDLATQVISEFEEYDFSQFEEVNKFIWSVAAVFPEVMQEDLQPIIESTSLLQRIDLCINVLSYKRDLINQYNGTNQVNSKPGAVLKNEHNTDGNDNGNNLSEEEDEMWVKKAHPEIKKRWEKFKSARPHMNNSAQEVALDDFRRLVSYGSPENNTHEWPKFIRRLDLTLKYPWKEESKQKEDIDEVARTLDEDHYGLDNPKQKICDQIAPRILNPSVKSQIMCFVGAPGVGKTSLAQSIAKALGLKLIRISVGGIRDEAQIRGHGVTYIGSQPGEIIREMVRAGVKNPVFVIDEIDKIGHDSVGGNPAAALLEMLDPEQNHAFKDHYLDYGVDLSKVLVITTANVEDTIIPALRDRMDIIRLPGYLESEKVEIAKRYLIPRWTQNVGLEKAEVKVVWDDDVVPLLIRAYTSEAGVRDLERNIATILRRLARRYLESVKNSKPIKEFKVDKERVINLLGPEKFSQEGARPTAIGEAIGLVWTPVGGDIIYVQTALRKKGSRLLFKTGLQGKVMNEADEVAMTLVEAKAGNDSSLSSILNKHSIHLHVPEGAIRKDGPSAGVTAFTALYSLVNKIPVRSGVAMTGEINLSGRVTAVGGIREKLVAADRAGIKEIIMPRDNERNLFDVPTGVKERLKFHLVETVDEVIDIAFQSL